MKLMTFISKWLFMVRYQSDAHRKFRSFITNFYDHYNDGDKVYHFGSFRITKCRFYDFPKSITIEIHSLSPGMIIGPKGETLDRFKAFMQKRYSKPVNIQINETNPFK